jgi:hypothetical protein
MGDTPDTAQRLAWLRRCDDQDADGRFLLDQIDTLTARAEKAETERDALRAALIGFADCEPESMEQFEAWEVVWRLMPQLAHAPSPVEGGE